MPSDISVHLRQETISPVMIRKTILCQSKRAYVGHIGSCLSIVEILAALYSGVLLINSPDDPDRFWYTLFDQTPPDPKFEFD